MQNYTLNVMAALNTWGIEYDANTRGFIPTVNKRAYDTYDIRIEKDLTEVEWSNVSSLVTETLKEFDGLSDHKYYPIRGALFKESDGVLSIYMTKAYDTFYWDYDHEECQYSHVYCVFKMKPHMTEDFVKAAAPFCWK